MNADKKTKERTRNFSLKFKEPLSSNLLEDLSKDRKFYPKYNVLFQVIKIGENVVGILAEDSFNIHYSINGDGITAKSFAQSDTFVIKKLKIMGDRIIEFFDLDDYEVIEGADYKYLENITVDDWFLDNEFINKIRNEFKGEEIPHLIQMKFVIKKDGNDKLINFVYENSEKMNQKVLLLEADKEYLSKILKAIGEDD